MERKTWLQMLVTIVFTKLNRAGLSKCYQVYLSFYQVLTTHFPNTELVFIICIIFQNNWRSKASSNRLDFQKNEFTKFKNGQLPKQFEPVQTSSLRKHASLRRKKPHFQPQFYSNPNLTPFLSFGQFYWPEIIFDQYQNHFRVSVNP